MSTISVTETYKWMIVAKPVHLKRDLKIRMQVDGTCDQGEQQRVNESAAVLLLYLPIDVILCKGMPRNMELP